MLPTTDTSTPPQLLRFWKIQIEFEYNPPPKEFGAISEDFDYHEKTSYATAQVAELLWGDTFGQIILWKIFSTLAQTAACQSLDYLQKLTINGVSCWCIDNGEVITLMTPDEY